jgi:hypothetical protein
MNVKVEALFSEHLHVGLKIFVCVQGFHPLVTNALWQENIYTVGIEDKPAARLKLFIAKLQYLLQYRREFFPNSPSDKIRVSLQ